MKHCKVTLVLKYALGKRAAKVSKTEPVAAESSLSGPPHKAG